MNWTLAETGENLGEREPVLNNWQTPYKLDTRTKRTFRPLEPTTYDDRILSFALPASTVSIWTLDGRQAIPFIAGEGQRALLPTRHGENDLLLGTP